MTIDRRGLLGLGAGAMAMSGLAGEAAAQVQTGAVAPGPALAPPDPTEVWRLWPGAAPGGEYVTVTPAVTERSTDPTFHDRFAQYTREPILTVMRPLAPNGASLVLIPGGGYRWSVVDKEGMDVARVFAAAGVTCFVLRYRLPGDHWAAGADVSLQDAQRAVRLVRSRAAELDLDPQRIGVLGASAGGHLAGMASARTDETYAAVDDHDRVSFRPDISFLMYPVATMADPFVHAGSRNELLGQDQTPERIAAYSLERMAWTGAAPVWLVHAIDDTSVPVENTTQLMGALRTAGVKTEVHLFEEGGHGFGIRLAEGRPCRKWPELALAFGRRHGWAP